MKKYQYENGKIVSEKEYIKGLITTFLQEHIIDEEEINEINTFEEAEEYIKNLWNNWTYDPETKIIEEEE